MSEIHNCENSSSKFIITRHNDGNWWLDEV